METYHIHIQGRVQGVGFRPFVFNLCNRLNLTGTVSNTIDGVHLFVNSDNGVVENLVNEINSSKPIQSVIEQIEVKKTKPENFDSFKIIESGGEGELDLLITPDFAMCPDCSTELHEEENRRYHYPFITCTNCGPRFSIINRIPYDRETTTMEPFKQCNDCEKEFNDPLDRRFFSQTNSCPTCSIDLYFLKGEQLGSENPIDRISSSILKGEIIAVKGVGGFLLLADATNKDAVEQLRKRKRRPHKPFAVMYPSLNMLKEDVGNELSYLEEEWQSPEAPIILYPLNEQLVKRLACQEIAPGLDRIGIMPPYAPILDLIISEVGNPLIATSANVSGSPIIYRDDDAKLELDELSDEILSNNREIVMPQDDSVVIYSSNDKKIMLRRSRGFAPSTTFDPLPDQFQSKLIAMGASLKSSLGFYDGKRVYVSQFLGDTSQLLSQQSYDHCLHHLETLLRFTPQIVAVDSHPDYYSTYIGEQVSEHHQTKLVLVQHHKAHFAAVLAENQLMNCEETVLGVVWDGTGYGDDQNIWGGEFFHFQKLEMKRLAHVPYFNHLSGERMSKEPRVAAFSLFSDLDDYGYFSSFFDSHELELLERHQQNSQLLSSSMGRVFDAVACIILDIERNSYEGQGAMLLQAAANKADSKTIESIDEKEPDAYFNELLNRIWQGVSNGEDHAVLAFQFHYWLAGYIDCLVSKYAYKHVCLSGGVFQNSLLLDIIFEVLGEKCKLYIHKELPPNDESIPYGQLAYVGWGIK